MNDLFTQQPIYPDAPGYVRGSETSKAAASSLNESVLTQLKRRIYFYACLQPNGIICDEIEVALGLSHQTASARIRELEMSGWLTKTDERRHTRSKRGAFIYRPNSDKTLNWTNTNGSE